MTFAEFETAALVQDDVARLLFGSAGDREHCDRVGPRRVEGRAAFMAPITSLVKVSERPAPMLNMSTLLSLTLVEPVFRLTSP